jgi:hypothetical protein
MPAVNDRAKWAVAGVRKPPRNEVAGSVAPRQGRERYERTLRQTMAEKNIGLICSLPEGRASKTPTIEQVLRLFEHQNKHALYNGDRLVKQFTDPARSKN